jgi:hypothetical protein
VQSTGTVHGGTVVKGTVLVKASQATATGTRLVARAGSGATVSPLCARSPGGCDLGSISASKTYKSLAVTIPKSMTSGKVALTVTAWATNAASAPYNGSISVTKKPTPSTKSSTNSGSTSNSNTSGGATGSTGSGSSTNTTTLPGSTSAFAPPSGAGGLSPTAPPSAQFPQIAPQAGGNPAVVPGDTQNMGALRPDSPQPQELTFQRLASTQAAWLAALLVAFSLLLTQVRLGKSAAARRRKGEHRRQRSGVFQA